VGIFVVDPYPLSRLGLARAIERTRGVRLVGATGDFSEAVDTITRARVSLIVVEPLVAPNAERELIRRLSKAAPEAFVVAISAHEEPGFVDRVRRAGVAAFVSKSEDTQNVIATIRRVLDAGTPGRGDDDRDRGGENTIEHRGPSAQGAGRSREAKRIMTTDHVYKKIEVTGSSTKGIEDAVDQALARASKSVREMRWFEVVDIRGHIEGEAPAHWQVTVKIGFTLEE
jgi:flavin-binding protein dodecin/CheY-like chemotaxis protein